VADSLDRLIADLDATTSKVHFGLRAATLAAGERAAAQARRNASGRRHLPGYPATITSEPSVGMAEVSAEVGPEKRGQGNLGHIIEHGGRYSRPHMDVHQAVEEELPRWYRAIADVGGNLL
jgi:hypothetical protein